MGCDCGYGHMHIHRHFFVRLIVALIVIGVVFYAGVKIGEIKEMLLQSGYGHNSHYGYMMPSRSYTVYGSAGMGVSGPIRAQGSTSSSSTR